MVAKPIKADSIDGVWSYLAAVSNYASDSVFLFSNRAACWVNDHVVVGTISTFNLHVYD